MPEIETESTMYSAKAQQRCQPLVRLRPGLTKARFPQQRRSPTPPAGQRMSRCDRRGRRPGRHCRQMILTEGEPAGIATPERDANQTLIEAIAKAGELTEKEANAKMIAIKKKAAAKERGR